MKSTKYIIGVDEVGRGPLAGRIFVGSVSLSESMNKKLKLYMKPDYSVRFTSNFLPTTAKLKDSKKLSTKQRQEWFNWVKNNNIPYSISAVAPSIIDKINVAKACNRAAKRAVAKLSEKYGVKKAKIVADAGIFVPMGGVVASFISFPKADETVPAVALASIVAKIARDREMVRFHKKFPQYGFDGHKGYGTKKHIHAIKLHGPSPIHRLTFIKNFHKIHR